MMDDLFYRRRTLIIYNSNTNVLVFTFFSSSADYS